MLKAIIFDFNGVILNDEPLHFSAMRDAVADLGIRLTKSDYWARYLPFDDGQCLEAICRDHSVLLNGRQRREALERKVQRYRQLIQGRYPLFPGAAQFIGMVSKLYPLAIASGARREEIESALEFSGLRHNFSVVVAAEDFVRGKPHPESFLLALDRLNNALGRIQPILPSECLVIEDSVGGVRGAKTAGMICLAVSNSYPDDMLQEADGVTKSLETLQIDYLRTLSGEHV
jgi:beta-phosphoglucomutase